MKFNKEQWQLTIYIPKALRRKNPLTRLRQLAKRQRRSLNFLAVEALLKYLEEQEKEGKKRR
jgi:predicted transcriptional regulator